MAKALKIGKQDMHFGEIIVKKDLNSRPESEYGDPKPIVDSMAYSGFSDNFNVNCFAATDEDAAHEIEIRKAVLTKLEADSTRDDDARKMLPVMNRLWKDEKGHLVEPRVFNNMAFRRLTNYPQAMIQRGATPVDDRGGDKAVDVLTSIPVNVKKYDSEYERVLDQLMENGANKQGTKDLSFLSKCRACLPLMNNPRIKEADIVNALGGVRGTGQKVYNLLIVHMRCEDAKLLERGALDSKDANYLKLETPKYSAWQTLHKNGKRPTVEEVEAIFENATDGNESKVLEGKAIRHFGQNIAQDDVTRSIFDSVIKADAEGLQKAYSKYAPILKEVDRLEKAGLLPQAYALLKDLKPTVGAVAPTEAPAPAEATA